MRVLVTGGTGFVGSHLVRALLDAGHEPSVLVRNPAKAESALGGLGLEDNFVECDLLDEEPLSAAIADSDAVIHCANVFSLDPANRQRMIDVNEGGTDRLITLAAKAGLDPIVHVSSLVALLPATGTVGPDSPVGHPDPAYAHSKALAERVARNHQDAGAPVVCIYPGLIWGPEDPTLGESSTLLINAIAGKFRLLNQGSVSISDVRDVADALTATLEVGLGPRRYMVTGHDHEFRSLVARVGAIAGKNLWSIRVPNAAALVSGKAADVARVRLGVDPALNYEGPWLVANGRPTDNSRAVEELGAAFRPLDETIEDSVHWLAAAGHIEPGAAA